MNSTDAPDASRCPYCNDEIHDVAGNVFECPRCGGRGAVRLIGDRRHIVAAELVERVDSDERRREQLALPRRQNAAELQARQDKATGVVADARVTGGMVVFSPATRACEVCAQLKGRYEPAAVPAVPVITCTGDGWADDCRCFLSVSGDSLWDKREAVIIETLWDTGGLPGEADLIRQARLPRAAVMAGLDVLVAQGYVTREPDGSPEDNRIRLRPRGLREIGDWPWERGQTSLLAMLRYRVATADIDRDKWAQLLSAVERAGKHVIEDIVYSVVRTAGDEPVNKT